MRDLAAATSGLDAEVEQHIAAFNAHQTIGHAADAVSAALVLNRPRAAEAAAEFLLRNRDEAGGVALQLARRVLLPGGMPAPAPGVARGFAAGSRSNDSVGDPSDAVRHTMGGRIHALRERLRQDPRNAVAWLDLARLYVRIGLRVHAERAVRVALGLAPDHRFVLRSASRFFLHAHQPDAAHALLRRSGATSSDPWLVAAEIAVATAAGSTPRFVKQARSLLQGGRHSAFQTAELASALATIEATAGRARVARQLFEQSLREPTDNAVAQAEWASRRLGLFSMPESALQVERAFEARAWTAYENQDWEEALAAAWDWLDDEPFASRAAVLGSVTAAVALDEGGHAVRLAHLGVLADPASVDLRMNLVFAHARAGQLEQAFEEHVRLEGPRLAGPQRVVWLANGGLIAYRAGYLRLGAQGYRAAVNLARELKDKTLEAVATAYWAGEALRATSERDLSASEVNEPPPVEDGQVGAVELSREDLDPEALERRASDGLRALRDEADLRFATVNLARARTVAANRAAAEAASASQGSRAPETASSPVAAPTRSPGTVRIVIPPAFGAEPGPDTDPR